MSQLRLHVCTYNIRGFNSTKVKYINDVLIKNFQYNIFRRALA